MKSTIDIPDALLKEAKLRAVNESITLRELVITAIQAYLLAEVSTSARMNEKGVATDTHFSVDQSGWPLLNRASDDKCEVTEELINDMREELGV